VPASKTSQSGTQPTPNRSPRQKWARRVYDRPGKKPTAEYEPDPLKLQVSGEQRGGTDFACQWIRIIFKDNVTLGALFRRLKLTEIERMIFPGGFEPCLVYDGFLEKADNGFESCLCTVGKRVWWKNKNGAVRHLRKFHFGLADSLQTGCAWPVRDRPGFEVVAVGVADLGYNVWSIRYSNEFVPNTGRSFSCSLFWLHLYSIHPHTM